jgi:hypothetical protein
LPTQSLLSGFGARKRFDRSRSARTQSSQGFTAGVDCRDVANRGTDEPLLARRDQLIESSDIGVV